jgi:hypothetical protein
MKGRGKRCFAVESSDELGLDLVSMEYINHSWNLFDPATPSVFATSLFNRNHSGRAWRRIRWWRRGIASGRIDSSRMVNHCHSLAA